MLNKIILSVVTLTLSAFVLIAASAETEYESELVVAITGSVTDASSGEGIHGATVAIKETDLTTTTDNSGTFIFTEVDPGNYTLSVNADGYQSSEKTLEVNEEGVLVEIELEPEQ
jgi:uncharacterized protein (DUF2141 family)